MPDKPGVRMRVPKPVLKGIEEAVVHAFNCGSRDVLDMESIEAAGRWLASVKPSSQLRLPRHIADNPDIAHGRGPREIHAERRALRLRRQGT